MTQSGGKCDSSKWPHESTSPITCCGCPRAEEEMEADTGVWMEVQEGEECEGCMAHGRACKHQVETTSGQARLIGACLACHTSKVKCSFVSVAAGPSKSTAGPSKKKEKAPGLPKSRPFIEDSDADFIGEEDPTELS
ncbi:hypothetical protein Moror_685 [Moniliophthora roreri MCA 2997]|uniref:Uncharacterized protein n=1 Tax=Moniliophthora roreri (strain MCA 2997) TaxID=1381753 RepID=V2WNW4_MONRO|nr:hypothetical protein Moror_685 [Moniliophthora roreri MCA 2997]